MLTRKKFFNFSARFTARHLVLFKMKGICNCSFPLGIETGCLKMSSTKCRSWFCFSCSTLLQIPPQRNVNVEYNLILYSTLNYAVNKQLASL